MFRLPIFYYPTTTYWVDDDALFLAVAKTRFSRYFNIRTSVSPSKTATLFSNYQSAIDPFLFLRGCSEHEDYDLPDHLPIDIDFAEIRKLSERPKKTDEVSVMIVDYHMPEMSGLELCRVLKNVPIKKILLTGNAHPQDAIRAFNDGIIDYFIAKDDPKLESLVINSINQLFRHYFVDLTQPLFHHIESDNPLPHTDPVFIDFFNRLCKERDIQEYYLLNKYGDLLLIDSQKKSFYFVIRSDKALDEFVELHQQTSDAVFFVKNIHERKKIPFFGIGKEPSSFPITTWSKYFYSPNVLIGREKYYYVIIERQ